MTVLFETCLFIIFLTLHLSPSKLLPWTEIITCPNPCPKTWNMSTVFLTWHDIKRGLPFPACHTPVRLAKPNDIVNKVISFYMVSFLKRVMNKHDIHQTTTISILRIIFQTLWSYLYSFVYNSKFLWGKVYLLPVLCALLGIFFY